MAGILDINGVTIHGRKVEQRKTQLTVTATPSNEVWLTWGRIELGRGVVGVPIPVDLSIIPLGSAQIVARWNGGSDTKTTEVIPSKGYVSPAPLGPDGTARTCRRPLDELRVVSGAEAGAMTAPAGEVPDWSGLWIKGAVITPAAGVKGSDFVIEATGRTDALLARRAGGGPVKLEHGHITGLERDIDGEPVALHEVNRLVHQGAMELSHCEISWGNDSWGLGSGGKLLYGYTHGHTRYFAGTPAVEQHRDSVQMQQGGGQVVHGTIHKLNAEPIPTRKDGTPVRTNTVSLPASSMFMINHDRPITGLVTVTDNQVWGGSSVALNVSGGIDPDQTLEWWVPRYDTDGKQIAGLIVSGNIIEELSRDGFVVRAPKEWMRKHFGPTWYETPVSDGVFYLRLPDGSLSNKFSDVALLGT